MRNLTIQRKKKTVGWAAKVLFYIEDAANPEIYLNTVPCRKLCELKNGEAKTLPIPEDAVQVFVAPAYGQTQPVDILPIPAGTEDVNASGEVFMDSTGGGFRFDNSPMGKPSKKGNALGIVGIIIGAVIVGILVGLANSLPALLPKTFTKDDMQITVTRSFKEAPQDGFDYCLDSSTAGILVLKDSFELMEDFADYSVKDYLDLTLYVNDMDYEIQEKEGRTYFRYTTDDYRFYCFGYKGSDAFWLVQIVVPEKNADNLETRVFKWANSVTFVS